MTTMRNGPQDANFTDEKLEKLVNDATNIGDRIDNHIIKHASGPHRSMSEHPVAVAALGNALAYHELAEDRQAETTEAVKAVMASDEVKTIISDAVREGVLQHLERSKN